jgi:beta-galactosidase
MDRRETTGEPAAIVLRPDRQAISADGEDLSVIEVRVVDSAGRIVPAADNEITFTVVGGKLIGVGNGNPSSHEDDKGTKRLAFNGLCCAIVQATKEAGEIRVTANGAGLTAAETRIAGRPAPARPAI